MKGGGLAAGQQQVCDAPKWRESGHGGVWLGGGRCDIALPPAHCKPVTALGVMLLGWNCGVTGYHHSLVLAF